MTNTKKKDKPEPENKKNWIFLKTNSGKREKVLLQDILSLKAEGDYTIIFTCKAKYIETCQLGKMIEILDDPAFLRIHRSNAVNIHKIDFIDGTTVTVTGAEIPVARNKKGMLKKALGI